MDADIPCSSGVDSCHDPTPVNRATRPSTSPTELDLDWDIPDNADMYVAYATSPGRLHDVCEYVGMPLYACGFWCVCEDVYACVCVCVCVYCVCVCVFACLRMCVSLCGGGGGGMRASMYMVVRVCMLN